MNLEWKEKICNLLVKTILGKDVGFTIIRKDWLHSLAREVNSYPNSKISVLKILRLDGTDFKTAMEYYRRMNT